MATNTIQYSDGREEIINTPKAFSAGDVVAVTHKRDGGVVVQRVNKGCTKVDGTWEGMCTLNQDTYELTGEWYFKFSIRAPCGWQNQTLTVWLYFDGLEDTWTPETVVSSSWTEITLGPYTNKTWYGSLTLTSAVNGLHSPVYFDNFRFIQGETTWDLYGEGGMEIPYDESDWDIYTYWPNGYPNPPEVTTFEFSTEMFTEGAHSLKML